MKSQRVFIGALTLGLLLAFAVGLSQAQELRSSPSAINQPQQACPDKYEPNDSFKTAWPLSPGPIKSYICCSWSDVDYFKFSVNPGDLIQLHLYSLPVNYNLCLYGPDEKAVECSTESGTADEVIEATASSGGTHYALIARVEEKACSSDDPYTFHLQIEPQEQPDLVITDVWIEEGYYPQTKNMCYQIRNVGDAVAPSGHYTFLSVDGSAVTSDLAYRDLAVGERLNRCFGSLWQCTLPHHTVNVCADGESFVAESDETNNCRTETWRCDVTPPQITSGPVVSDIGQTSATVSWITDEQSDSVVAFGRYAGEYEDQERDATRSTEHEILLTDLSPATVYHYDVSSTDASSNTVTSREGFFETEPEQAGEPPNLASPMVTRVEGDRELYRVTVPVSDALGIERVELYVDEALIGVDYSAEPSNAHALGIAAGGPSGAPDQYEFYLDPAARNMSRTNFFSVTHTVRAEAFDWSGLWTPETSVAWTPDYEPPPINFTVEPSYHPTRYVDGPADTLPAGTTIDVWVRASEDAWDWDPLTGEPRGPIESAIERVEFEVGGTTVHTWYPDEGEFEHTYDWQVEGLGVGTYKIWVRAYAHDGSHRTAFRTLSVEVGEPSLDLSRSVARIDNYVRVRLTVRNGGTASTSFDRIEDNIDGFQPISKTETIDNYKVSPDCSPDGESCGVEIDVWDDTGGDMVTLGPGQEVTVEYLAIPILYPELDETVYAIGAEDALVYQDSEMYPEAFHRPCEMTDDDELLAAEVGLARRAADYLIVTNPDRLFDLHDDGEVNELLSAMAELAQLKAGLLGYVSTSDATSVRDAIVSWGSDMKGSDGVDGHFLSNGYVLLVGEAEIMGSWSLSDFGAIRGTVDYSDLPYGNTSGEWRAPELIVGRVIGNSAAELTIPIETSSNVHKGEPGFEFDRSHALAVSGSGDGVTAFERNVDDVADILDDEFTVRTLKMADFGDPTAEFKAHDANRDVVFYRDHGWPTAWSGVINTEDFTGHDPVDFGNSKPFAFGCNCFTGLYEDEHFDDDGDDIYVGENSIAEAFLQHGAAVYIGSTEISMRYRNNVAAQDFLERWVGSSHSVGRAFRDFKRNFNNRRGRRYWIAEYNLYGDPKYGSTPAVAGAMSMPEVVASEPTTSLEVVVPDYEITTTLGITHFVTIPGGGLLLELDQPMVPFYTVDVDYPGGYRVQDVILTGRSGLTTTTGLNIPDCDMASDGTTTTTSSPASEDGWWPEGTFDWYIHENADGGSTLVVTMYPFYYNALTTNVEFYRNYSFDVRVTPSTVGIESLTTDQDAYSHEDEVRIDLTLGNPGDAQDAIVDVAVQTLAGETVDGLLLRSLKSLAGTASFSARWDTTGFDPGHYHVEAEVRDSVGNVLDRRIQPFRLGIYSGQLTALTATPGFFQVGDTVSTSLTFRNTGTIPITGTARIEIQDDDDEAVQTFVHDVTNLPPSEAVTFDDGWDTSGTEGGTYSVTGYVLYDSRPTSIEIVTVSTEAHIYLPLVLRNSQ